MVTDPSIIHPEDADDEWVSAVPGRSIRLSLVTGALVLLLAVGGGFWGGVVAEHHRSGTTASSAAAGRFAALRAAAGVSPGGAASPGGQGDVTTGTVIDVSGNLLEITDSNGNLVKVEVPASATVTRTVKAPVSSLQVGDTVVISGSPGAGGTVTATTVRALEQGVSLGGALGGGRRGFGGGGSGG